MRLHPKPYAYYAGVFIYKHVKALGKTYGSKVMNEPKKVCNLLYTLSLLIGKATKITYYDGMPHIKHKYIRFTNNYKNSSEFDTSLMVLSIPNIRSWIHTMHLALSSICWFLLDTMRLDT